jgi:hypothetical protein
MPWRPGIAVTAAFLLLVLLPAAPDAARGGGPAASPQASQAKPTQPASQAKPAPKPKKAPSAKMAEPWPDDATIAAHKLDAEGRRLFQTADTLPITLAADFKAVNRDRNPESTKTFPATLTVAGEAGAAAAIPVTLRTRGKIRLDPKLCSFVPLSLEFSKKEVKGTPFDGQRKLKMVTHCQNDDDYDQYVLKEYFAYRLFNLVSPRSFRVRLAKATYVDAANGKTVASHYAVFIEDDDDLARRLEGRSIALPHTAFVNYDIEALTTMMVFQYMIGNTDFSIYALHNVRMVQTRFRPLYPIIWDFDVSGLVSPVYGAPDPRLELSSLRERKYRGPCRTLEAFGPTFAAFKAKEAESLALLDSLPDLRQRPRDEVRQFLARFYTTLGRPDQLKKEFVDKCKPENNTM